jgi:hypothetical protein
MYVLLFERVSLIFGWPLYLCRLFLALGIEDHRRLQQQFALAR